MRRFKSLILLFMSLIGGAWSQTADKPNIVIMMADDLGYGDLACFGHKVIQTPNLDKLAKKGARLTSFYSAHSTCSPSRAGMMSGRNPFRSGIYTYIGANSCVNLRAQEVTIGEICKKAGYSTAFFGKWGLIGDMDDKSQAFPNDQGFDHWFATHNNALPSHKDPENFYENGKALGVVEGFSSQLVVDRAMEWLGKRDTSKPFCVVLWFHEPHLPLAQPNAFDKKYTKYGEKLNKYYANVDHMDHQIGRFLDYLDKNELTEKSWITFTSDNGPKKDYGSTGGLKGGKSSFHEGGYREPTIMYWKGKLEGGKTDDGVYTFFDFVPTLYDLLKVEKMNSAPLDGTSMLPLFKSQKRSRSAVPIWMGLRHTSIRIGKWKVLGQFEEMTAGQSLTEYLKTRKVRSYSLYNLETDVKEKVNLKNKFPEVLQDLKLILDEKILEVQKEIVPWNGLNVIPSVWPNRLVPKAKVTSKKWKEMTPEEQEYFGMKPREK